jgi:flagellar biosynthesis/type III secretory pathway chaperone
MNETFDKNDWDPLVDLLREEVQEYGGLYNLLDRQQNEIFNREPDLVMQTNVDIESHMSTMNALRERRENQVTQMAVQCACDDTLTLTNMLPRFPEFIRPLLKALIDEVNAMVNRTRRKARQNHLLLSRTMEITQEALRMAKPADFSKTYTRKGQVGMAGRMPTTYKMFV